MIEYEISSLSMGLDDFIRNEDKSYKYLFDNSIHIQMNVKDVLSAFYEKAMGENPEKMGDYNICPEYGEASKNYRFRFMILQSDDDYVLVLFKIVDPKTASIKNYFTVSYPPISWNGKSVEKVIDALKMYPDIKYIVEFSTEDDFTNNNYYNVSDNFKNMNKSAWKSKHGINKMKDLIRFEDMSEDIPMIDDYITDLTDRWNKLKGKTSSVKSDLNLVKMARKGNSVRIFSFWYKDVMVGFSISIDMLGKYMCIITSKTLNIGDNDYISSYLGEDDGEIVNSIRMHLGSYVQYVLNQEIFEKLGYKAMYYYGDTRSRTLRVFKKKFFKNTIFYKRSPARCNEEE